MRWRHGGCRLFACAWWHAVRGRCRRAGESPISRPAGSVRGATRGGPAAREGVGCDAPRRRLRPKSGRGAPAAVQLRPLVHRSRLLLTRPARPLLPLSPPTTGTGVVTPPRPLTCVALGGMQTAGLTHAAAPRLSRGPSARRQTAAACAVAGAVPVYSGMRRCGAVDLVSSGRVSSGRACLAAAVATSTRRAARGGPTRLATTAMFEVRHCVPASRVQGRRASAQRQGVDLRWRG